MTLDLGAIKARLDAATSWTGSGDSESMHRLAAWDIAALVAEVERLRGAIKTHKRRAVIDPQPWDRDLWGVIDA